jgi:SAM-dependent methyltransferase
MHTLAQVYQKYSHPSGWGDKGTAHDYLPTYEKFMTRTDGIVLLEIGVLHGHSIAMWNEFFTNSRIIGIDVNIGNLQFDLDNVYQCNGVSAADIDATFPGLTFDYVIDDGSHNVNDQLASLDVFLPRMKPDGVYFIEDIAGDAELNAIVERLDGLEFTVIDGRQPGRQPDEIMVVVGGARQ